MAYSGGSQLPRCKVDQQASKNYMTELEGPIITFLSQTFIYTIAIADLNSGKILSQRYLAKLPLNSCPTETARQLMFVALRYKDLGYSVMR